MSTNKQLGVIEIIKIVYGICSAEFDIFHFLHIDIKDFLSLRRNTAELNTVKRLFNRFAELTCKQRRHRAVVNLKVTRLTGKVNDFSAVNQDHKLTVVNVNNRTV